jgi:tetratricopeptide (TPR) repeat protein
LNKLGDIEADRGQIERALGLYREALAIDERALGPAHPQVATDLSAVGFVYVDSYREVEARPFFERSLAIFEDGERGSPNSLAWTRFGLARALWPDPGQRVRARTLAEQALAAYDGGAVRDEEERAEIAAWLREHPAEQLVENP